MAAVHPSQDAAVFDDSGRLYRLIADTIPLMVWTARADGEVDFVNQRVLEYSGLDAREFEGWGWKKIVHPEDWERCVAVWTQALQTGARSENEMRLRRADGEYRWHHGSGVPLHDAGGRVVRWFGIAKDVEAEVRSAQMLESMVEERTRALRESEQRFQLFLEHLPANAWIRDSQFRYTYVNRLYAKAWDVEPQALIGHDAAEFFPAEVVRYFRDADDKVRKQGAPIQFVDSLPSGRWLKVKFPLPDGAGGIGVAGVALDISEQSRLEEALRASEQRFRSFMDNAPAVAWIKDANFRYTYVNRMHKQMFGRGLEEMLGHDDFELHPENVARELRNHDEAALHAGGGSMQTEETVPYSDNTLGRWLVVKFPLADVSGKTGIAGIAFDITDRTRLEEALHESEERFRAFMDHAPALAWIKDARLCYSYVNRAFERYHDRPAKDLLGRDDFELFPAEVARYFRTDDEAVLKGREATQKLRQYPYANGDLAHWLVVKFPFADASGATGLAGIAIDVTPRVEAEEKARRYADDVRNLVNRLVQAQEAERRRVADELHDLIGQNLTALGIDLQTLKQRLQSSGDLIAGPGLDSMAALVETTIDSIRGVMTDLRPAALDEFGLVPALRWHASLFSKRTGMKVSTNVSGRELRLPRDTELALFRIVQEALTNAAKHSGGTAVEIAIRYGEGLHLTVEDDGRGFAEPAGARSARRGGFGLPTMRERAEAHGGTLRVEFPGRGTRLVVEMPAKGHAD